MNIFGNSYAALLADCEKRLEAALNDCARLRQENEQLKKLARPPVMMIGFGGGDERGGDDGVQYVQSDGGW
jgi:hypothetical protein